MAKRIIVLSGPVCSGKTTLGDALIHRHGFVRFKTQDLLRTKLGAAAERRALQKAGESLDRKTKGGWVADALVRELQRQPEDAEIIVDAVRIENQIEGIRNAFGLRVTHVHLTAPVEELSRRYETRHGELKELASYKEVVANPTEGAIEKLAEIADIVIDTRRSMPGEVVVRVAAHLGLYGRGYDRLVDVLVGGQYGSEGKGHVASYLAPEYDVLVRVGGPNAGHKVYEEPKPFTFHLLPSGTMRNPKAHIVLGPGAVLSVDQLQKEVSDCQCANDRLTIDPRAMIIEKADQKKEAKLVQEIGSTGRGVGAATARKIMRTSAHPKVRLAGDLADLRPFVREACAVLDDAFAAGKRVFLEGTQGTALSLHHGHYPYVTSRDTTVSGCLAESGIAPSRVRKVIMVCRTYPIRVESPADGDSGHMNLEISLEEISRRSEIPLDQLQRTERTSTTNRKRRIAEFDWELLRRAASLNGPTDVAVSFADYLSIKNRDARRFEQLTADTIRFIEEVERVAAAPVSLVATRFHYRSIIDRRAW